MTLQEFFTQHPRLALGLSGGVDSAYLLAEAVRCGCRIQPYFVDSPFQPRFELEHARRLCEEQGVELKVLPAQPLADENVRQNGPLRCYYCKKQVFGAILAAAKADGFDEIIDGTNASDDASDRENVRQNGPLRCYYCKKQVFGAILAAAKADGFDEIIDGTNASDDASDRPGMRALEEMRVYSPLRLCGVTKAQVRQASRELGLFTWNKPAYACLATRIPTGTAITPEALQRVEAAENELFRLGFSNFRVRCVGDTAKLQLPAAQFGKALEQRPEALQRVEAAENELFRLGFSNFRVRCVGDTAKLQLPAAQFGKALEQRKELVEALKPHFPAVVLDLEPRGEE